MNFNLDANMDKVYERLIAKFERNRKDSEHYKEEYLYLKPISAMQGMKL